MVDYCTLNLSLLRGYHRLPHWCPVHPTGTSELHLLGEHAQLHGESRITVVISNVALLDRNLETLPLRRIHPEAHALLRLRRVPLGGKESGAGFKKAQEASHTT